MIRFVVGKTVSIRAARSRARRHEDLAYAEHLPMVSIRAARSRARRLCAATSLWAAVVYHSAPRARARGDTRLAARLVLRRLFQSAPRARARGDPLNIPDTFKSPLFQSAPRARARGDLDCW